MKNFNNLEKAIGIIFQNKKLLKNAFIHRSYLNENKKYHLNSNEKLEFLGDSILSLITSLYLYQKYPSLQEGEYTNIKASIVKTESLYESAKSLKLDSFLFLSKGEEKNKVRQNKSILADCLEALIASIFLDRGFEITYQFVLKFIFINKLDYIVNNLLYLSPKNRLQEFWQNKYKKLPDYKIIKQIGPEHKKQYHIGIFINGKKIGEGIGFSKKEAEEKAAINTLNNLGI
ncbi:MAG: Ribonuclease III [uncultured bacterium]|nr:MAG: Ribonuclease III [uncultured bacterium]